MFSSRSINILLILVILTFLVFPSEIFSQSKEDAKIVVKKTALMSRKALSVARKVELAYTALSLAEKVAEETVGYSEAFQTYQDFKDDVVWEIERSDTCWELKYAADEIGDAVDEKIEDAIDTIFDWLD